MNTKIAIDGTSALAQEGGIGRFTRGLIQGLAAVDQERSYIIGYTRDVDKSKRFTLPPNFQWRSIGLTEKQAIWLWHRLRLPLPLDLWLGRPALYHSPDYTLPPLARARGVVTIHDLSFETLSTVHHPKLRRYLQRAVPYSIQKADHVFADSESTRQDIMRYYQTPPDKITVVYPGVESRFRPLDSSQEDDRHALEQVRHNFKLERPFILSVGTIEPRKNTTTLIRAFAEYHKRGDRAYELIIAGGGGWLGEREKLQKLVEELALQEHVRFVGFVPDEQLPALINLTRALIYPSLYEGFGLPVLEALACGVPVITSRNTSLPESGGTAAHYIEPADNVEALVGEMHVVLHDERERQRMIADGLRHAANFTWEATARHAITLYEQLLGSA